MKKILQAGVFLVVLFFVVMGGADRKSAEVKANSFPEEFFDENWYYFKHHRENAEIASMRHSAEGLRNHYYTKGIALGYSPCVAFDPKEYLRFNSDIAGDPGFNSMEGAYRHFVDRVLYGSEKSRRTSLFFQAEYYASVMAKEMPGASTYQLIQHYCTNGVYEARLGSNSKESKALKRTFDLNQYFKYNNDVYKAFSTDDDGGKKRAFGHFLSCAIVDGEGRRSADAFQISYYAGKIGMSCENAFWHYINTGYQGDSDDTIQKYTITYNANGGSGAPAAQGKIIGINLTLSSVKPTRTGYTFQGWATSASASSAQYAAGSVYTGNSNLALYAVWKRNTYTVTYNLNGGTSSAIASQTKVYGTDLTLSAAIPTRENYGFAGWATSAGASSAAYAPGGVYKTEASVTLYAVWKLNQYTISYDANGGSGAPANQIKSHGEALALSTAKPIRTGYDFMGWGTSAGDSDVAYAPGASYTVNTSVKLFAVWRIKTFTVRYDINGGDSSLIIPEQIKTYGRDLILSNAEPTRANYGFAGWAVSKDAASALYHPGDAYKQEREITLYAVWKKDVYRVIYNANTDGEDDSVTGLPESFEREAGEEIRISSAVPSREGYTFRGWGRIMEGGVVKQYKAGESFNENTTLILYADWSIDTYPVNYFNVGEDGEYNRWKTQTKTYGEDLVLADTAPFKTGYHFKGWAVSESSSVVKYRPGDSYPDNKKLDLYAVWELKKYTVSYDANGGTNAPSDQVKKHGEPLKLSISMPYCLGYTFLGWSTRASDNAAEYESGQEYTKDADLKLYAVWESVIYTVSYDANGGYFMGAPSPDKKAWGNPLTLTDKVPVKPGYDFAGWSSDKNAVSAAWQSGGEYTNNEDAVLYAVWKVSECTITYDANGGTGAPSPQKKAYNEAAKLSAFTPSRTGYDFIGWGKTPEDIGAAYLPEDLYTDNESVVLYALWKIKSYTVSYDANGGMFVSSIRDDVKQYGIALRLTGTKPVKDGFDFLGWSEYSSAKTPSYEPGGLFTQNRDTVLYAVWGHITAGNGNVGASGDHTGADTAPGLSIQTEKDVYKVVYGIKPFPLNARADSGAGLSYRSDSPKVAKVSQTGTVTVTGCGIAKITITAGAGNRAVKKTVSVQVVPKKQSIKVKYIKRQRRLRVEWKKDGKSSGYVVCISKSKKFAKKDTREYPYGKSVNGRIYSGLKKGTYYLRVRSYVKVGKKKYYGGWSSAKKVKIS